MGEVIYPKGERLPKSLSDPLFGVEGAKNLEKFPFSFAKIGLFWQLSAVKGNCSPKCPKNGKNCLVYDTKIINTTNQCDLLVAHSLVDSNKNHP